MTIRLAAALSTLLFAALLALTVYESFTDPPRVIVPTGGLEFGPQDDLPAADAASEALRQRTALQRWRADTGPSPGAPRVGAAVGGRELPGTGGGAGAPDRAARVAAWLAEEEKDRALLRDRRYVVGQTSLPDERLSVLEQAAGRDWRRTRTEVVPYSGGWIIFGVSLLLSLFLLAVGRIRLEAGESGERVGRFSAFERANHWLTAGSFILLALTGLTILYGQYVLPPLLGAAAYGAVAAASAYLHIAFVAPFVLGVLVMIVLWTEQNLPRKADWEWLRRAGGFFRRGDHPPAYRFNAGQKFIYWGVVGGMLVMLLSGLALTFPLLAVDVITTQTAQTVHAVTGLAFIGLILGHIYIGTIGMQGAFDAMWRGDVDRTWMREHHPLWQREAE